VAGGPAAEAISAAATTHLVGRVPKTRAARSGLTQAACIQVNTCLVSQAHLHSCCSRWRLPAPLPAVQGRAAPPLRMHFIGLAVRPRLRRRRPPLHRPPVAVGLQRGQAGAVAVAATVAGAARCVAPRGSRLAGRAALVRAARRCVRTVGVSAALATGGRARLLAGARLGRSKLRRPALAQPESGRAGAGDAFCPYLLGSTGSTLHTLTRPLTCEARARRLPCRYCTASPLSASVGARPAQPRTRRRAACAAHARRPRRARARSWR